MWFMDFIHWVEWWTGANNPSGPEYGFWSGFGSDLTEFTIIGGLVTVYRKHNCHVRGCWRVGRHPVGTWMVCRRHNPGDAPSPDDIVREHQRLTPEGDTCSPTSPNDGSPLT